MRLLFLGLLEKVVIVFELDEFSILGGIMRFPKVRIYLDLS